MKNEHDSTAVRAPREPAVHKLSAEAAARVGKVLEFMASEYKRVGYVQRDDDDLTRTALRVPGEGTPHDQLGKVHGDHVGSDRPDGAPQDRDAAGTNSGQVGRPSRAPGLDPTSQE